MSEFLNVVTIRKIAAAKGFTVERTVTLKQRPYVQILDPKGRVVEGGKTGNGFTLGEAKRILEGIAEVPPGAERRPDTAATNRRREQFASKAVKK